MFGEVAVRADPRAGGSRRTTLVAGEGAAVGDLVVVRGRARGAAAGEIGVRPSTSDGGAWARPADGRGASLPEGDVVVIRTRTDTRLLPADPELAELLRARTAPHGGEPACIEGWR